MGYTELPTTGGIRIAFTGYPDTNGNNTSTPIKNTEHCEHCLYEPKLVRYKPENARIYPTEDHNETESQIGHITRVHLCTLSSLF